jgi:hypothetical protein
MRSLTQSSAGPTGPTFHLFTTVPPPTSSVTFLSTRHTPAIPHALTVTRRRSTAKSLPPKRHSFFDLDNDSHSLSIHAKDQVNLAIQNSLAETTIKRYSGAIRQYISFCDSERVPEHLRFPADEFILCAFAASSAGKHSGSTPRSRLSALKAWHIAHNIEWKGSTRLRYVLNGVHNLAPGSSRRPPRPPINATMLSQLVESLDTGSPFDAAVAACATTAFWGQCRLGELLPSSAPCPTPLPTRSNFKRSLRNPDSCLLRLPRTKTHHHGQDIVLVDQRFPINPISLLKNHLRVNKIPSNSPIFSYITEDGLRTLTKTTLLQRCNQIWQPLGYPHTTGHCFRIGGTTELLIAGTPPDVVKATGRWSSESFLRYWRSLDDIAPQHIRNLHTFTHNRKRHTSTTTGG